MHGSAGRSDRAAAKGKSEHVKGGSARGEVTVWALFCLVTVPNNTPTGLLRLLSKGIHPP